MTRLSAFGQRLYRGDVGYDFIGKRRRWYVISGVLVLICVASMVFRGFNFGIDFAGGNTFQVPAASGDLNHARSVVQQQLDALPSQADGPAEIASAQVVGAGGDTSALIKTTELERADADKIKAALAEEFRADIVERLESTGKEVTDASVLAQVSNNAVSASWGGDISRQAIIALGVFLVAVFAFFWIRFTWKMAAGAMVSLVHDLVIAAGVYSLIGFEVTPSSVIGLLTILGFSLYDTVVVFDRIDENVKSILGGSRRTYSEAANLAVNQTLMRSINTSLIALLPVAGLLFVGAGLLGAGTLKDLALVLLVGTAAGAYSSIFLAAPVVCDLTEREPRYAQLRKRVLAKRASAKSVKDSVQGAVVTIEGSEGVEATATSGDDDREPVGAGAGGSTTPRPGARPATRSGGRPQARRGRPSGKKKR